MLCWGCVNLDVMCAIYPSLLPSIIVTCFFVRVCIFSWCEVDFFHIGWFMVCCWVSFGLCCFCSYVSFLRG